MNEYLDVFDEVIVYDIGKNYFDTMRMDEVLSLIGHLCRHLQQFETKCEIMRTNNGPRLIFKFDAYGSDLEDYYHDDPHY